MSNFLIGPEHLEKVTDRASLFAFLKTALGWPVSEEDLFTYEVTLAEEIEQTAKVTRIVPFTANDPYLLILAEFTKPILRGSLRRILQGIRSDIRKRAAYNQASLENIVFLCAEPGYGGIRFAHFTEKAGRQPKLSVFGWDRDHVYETHTLRHENLPKLRMGVDENQKQNDLFEESIWHGSGTLWPDAWKVEKVTNDFFRKFEVLFNKAIDPKLSPPKDLITGFSGEPLRLFAQRVFNRLLFIRFLERKSWLSFNGRKDYLMALWENYEKNHAAGETFYASRLQPLFFSGLNMPEADRNPAISALIGDVPYLNGGLFEQEEDEKDPRIVVPDSAIEPFLTGLLYIYNFTVTESAPDDVEVAVDPEMLGKVFERLVNKDKRHSTGSYYTPRPIVSFMCREALKGVLPGQDALIDLHSVEGIDVETARCLLADISRLRIVDPACGSGAYLLGMLHEIHAIMSLLDTAAKGTSREDHARKLEIISNNLYGVDKEQFAVNIARLRLWLSLAVDYIGDVPEPLPNLDFKIEKGDSLTAPTPEQYAGSKAAFGRDIIVQKYFEAKSIYQNEHEPEAKARLKYEISSLRGKIFSWTHFERKRKSEKGPVYQRSEPGFDWWVDFSEVFADGGFDIVLANPPYVRQEELGKDYKEDRLKPVHPEVYAGTADLYVYFYSRAVQCLKPGGMLAFISSNKWFRAAYGTKLREHIADRCSILSITDFGDLPVFEATAYPMIFIAQKKGQADHNVPAPILTEPKTLDEPYPDVLAVIREHGLELPPEALAGSEWRLMDAESGNRKTMTEATCTPLNEYVPLTIYSGIKTGYNAAFIIDIEQRNSLVARHANSDGIIKPFARGRDTRKWHVRSGQEYLIYTPPGIDIDAYPAVKEHLSVYRQRLEARAVQQPWWELQQAQNRKGIWDSPKIVFPDIANAPRFALDYQGIYMDMTAFIMPFEDLYLLGVLNSEVTGEIVIGISATIRGGYFRYKRQYVEKIPIPNAPASDRASISALVEKCLSAKGVACEAWEAEINERVARLYGL